MSKLLFYDIETSPLITYAWQIYEANAIKVIKDTQILTFAYKWANNKRVKVVGQNDFKDYKPGINNDKSLVQSIWDLFNEADVVIAHNGNQFDQKTVQARMMVHDIHPPEPYQQIDTKLVARRYARFTSNKLDDLGKSLDLGQKLDTGGFKIWEGCMAGDPQSWAKMKKYNKQDVVLLEQLYKRLLPWIGNHPALNVLESRPESCRNCGATNIQAGTKYRATSQKLYQYFRCQSCGAVHKSRIPEYSDEKPKYV